MDEAQDVFASMLGVKKAPPTARKVRVAPHVEPPRKAEPLALVVQEQAVAELAAEKVALEEQLAEAKRQSVARLAALVSVQSEKLALAALLNERQMASVCEAEKVRALRSEVDDRLGRVATYAAAHAYLAEERVSCSELRAEITDLEEKLARMGQSLSRLRAQRARV